MNNLGCNFLEEGINFEYNAVCDCCISHHDGRGRPVLIENYNGGAIDWNIIFNRKEKRIAAQKEKTIYDCENCYHLSNYTFKDERKISEFHFSHCQACNARCIYCSDERSGTNQNYDVLPVIQDLIEKNFYKPGGEATFQGGEPTLMKHFDELVALFIKNGTKVRIHSSAIKYSPIVEEALKINKAVVVTSLDSGYSDTYKKIKNVDSFNTVVSNLKKYCSANSYGVIIKYIIIPGVNDNLKEIDKFFDIAKEIVTSQIALDIELQYAMKYQNKFISPHIYLLVDYFNKKADEYKIKVLIYSFLSYVLKNRKDKKSKLLHFKPLFSILVNKLNDKSKNIKYYR